MALGVNTSAAFSGLNANLGSFFGGVADPADVAAVTEAEEVTGDEAVGDGDFVAGSGVVVCSEVVMELAEGVSFLGGAGGGCNVSGRFVSLNVEDDGDDDDDAAGWL